MSRAILFLVLVYTVSGHNTTVDNVEYIHDDCIHGVQVITQKKFIIQSNRYPNNYPFNYRCSYFVKGPKCPTIITLKFLDFDVEDSEGCSKDRLEVVNRDKLCGYQRGKKNYFTEKGSLNLRFVSDDDGTARGYKILVTRKPCHGKKEPVVIPDEYDTERNVRYSTTTESTKIIQNTKCCQNIYSEREFTLTSPNFPYSMSIATECVFEILKSNDNVCQLEVSLNFFSLGKSGTDCSKGFLEINGERICGCKANVKFTSPFKEGSLQTWRFVNDGSTNAYSGFVLNIKQEECSKDHMLDERVILDQFKEDEDADEETGFNLMPRVNVLFVKDKSEDGYCLGWNQQQFNALYEAGLPVCKRSDQKNEEEVCAEINYLEGLIHSPNYPFYYPEDLTICFKFKKQPGYCSFRLDIKDFHLENSSNCENDYVLLPDQKKYCGDESPNIVYLDLHTKPSENMYFITDSFNPDIAASSKGFFGSYNQILCEDEPVATSPMPTLSCNRLGIEDTRFTLEVLNDERLCKFTVKKNSPNICAVNLYFEDFDLACGIESLVIDRTMYCGRLTGQSVKVNMGDQDLKIVYYKTGGMTLESLGFRIQVLQLSNDCINPEISD